MGRLASLGAGVAPPALLGLAALPLVGIIVKKEPAQKAIESLVSASSSIATALENLRGDLEPQEFKKRAHATGRVLASIQLELMAPLLREHPDLDPDK